MKQAMFVAVILSLAVPVRATDWSWNGYLGVNYMGNTQKGDPFNHPSFDSEVFALRPSVRIDDKIKVVSEIDFEHSPQIEAVTDTSASPIQPNLNVNSNGELDVSAAYGEYAPWNFLKIRAGKFFTPMGFYNHLYYAVPTFATIQTPRTSIYTQGDFWKDDGFFFQRHATGLWLAGDYEAGGLHPYYDIFITNGKSFSRSADDNEHKAVGAKIRLPVSLGEGIKLTPIFSVYNDKFKANDLPTDQNYLLQTTVVPGLEANSGDLTARAEFATSSIRSRSPVTRDINDHLVIEPRQWKQQG